VPTNRSARWRVAAVSLLLAGVGLIGNAGTALGASSCSVRNGTTLMAFGALQSAVDAASAGDSLVVSGRCVGLTTVVKDLTISGRPGATLDGGGAGSVLTIGDGVATPTVTLLGLRITRGSTAGVGGGIHANGADLTLVGSIVTGNTARTGGGIYAQFGTLALVGTDVQSNVAVADGGGIGADHGTVTLQDSRVRGNRAQSAGGITNGTNVLHLTGWSSVDHNSAALDGGGIVNGDGSTFLHDRSFVGHNAAGRDGGGIFNVLGRVTLADRSSVRWNQAARDGGGVFDDFFGSLTLQDASSIARNTAIRNGGGVLAGRQSALTLDGSGRIAGNRAGGAGGGVWVSNQFVSLANAVVGTNVVRNSPDDLFAEP